MCLMAGKDRQLQKTKDGMIPITGRGAQESGTFYKTLETALLVVLSWTWFINIISSSKLTVAYNINTNIRVIR